MKLKREQLAQMTINELESLSHQLTKDRQLLRQQGMLVQAALSDRIEAERVAKMLGKPAPQTIAAKGIESAEGVNG